MTAPALTAYIQGQGVASADALNSMVQSCDTAPQLRAFVGLPGMQVYLRGITTPDDGGQGNFYWVAGSTAPDNNQNIIVPNGIAVGAWIRLDGGSSSGAVECIPVTQFGAKGDGVHDDTAAIQATINAVRAAGGGVVCYPGPANYLVTSSLNSTGVSGANPIWHQGVGKFISKIVHTFPITEAYPVIDGAGNTRGGVTNLSIIPQGTSYATCAYFGAKGAAGGSIGNLQTLQGSEFQAGNVAGDAAVVLVNVDLSRVIGCEVYGGGGGVVMGEGGAANVHSKFITPSSGLDWTQGYIENSEISAQAAPAISFTGGGALIINETYAALTGAGSSKIIEVTQQASGGNTLIGKGLRCENQSSATGVACIYFTAPTGDCDIHGFLETDSAGAMIASGASGTISASNFRCYGSTGAFFALNASITTCLIDGASGSGAIGTCTAVASCFSLVFRGGLNASQILTLFGSISGLNIAQGGDDFTSLNKYYFAPTAPSTYGRGRMMLSEGQSATTAYTNPSAQTIFSATLNLATLGKWSIFASPPTMNVEIDLSAFAFASSGTFAITLVQGANSVSLFSVTPPTATGPVKIRIKLPTVSSPSLITFTTTEVVFSGNAPIIQNANPNGASPAAITPALGNATLNIVFTNSSSIGALGVDWQQIV